jgi:7,8-dihydropterin-6-yl-methyl-4-(beta-D-ribofuranosyl)aminobenzene 5'-phosphate synthase
MKVKATVLCENSVISNIGALAEHGWAVFLETDQGNLLFDTGQGLALVNNARYFKKDLSRIQGIVLSHHHIDHTGGLMAALEASGPVPVYAHKAIFKESYLIRGPKPKYIGIPFTRTALESKGAEFRFNTDFREILPDVFLTGGVPRRNDFETGDADQVILKEGQFVKDPLEDDQSLIIKTAKGLFVILGCSHAGIINILNYAIEKTGEDRIQTVIGGTHLGPISTEQRERSIEALQAFRIERLGVSHCTGTPAAIRLTQVFGDRFFFCNVGTVVEAE